MRNEQDLLNLMKASGMGFQKNSGASTSVSPATQTSDKIDYWEWYNTPGNPIREWDRQHGVYLERDDDGYMHFFGDRETLFPATETENLYPIYFQMRTFEKFSTSLYSMTNHEIAQKALNLSRAYVKNIDRIIQQMRGAGLYFVSRTKGSGKTYLSTIVGNELSRIGKRVLWYSMPNLLQEIKNSYDRDSGVSTADVIDRVKKVPFLILDDIGVERQTAWVNETVFSILDFRMTLCKPTLFTSNDSPDELHYDERIIDRIRSMATIVPLPEENIRRRLSAHNDLNKFLGV